MGSSIAVVVAFLAVSGAWVGGDLAERWLGTDAFALPPLRAGDRFLYDGVLETPDGTTVRPGLVTVRVGEPRDAVLADRSAARILPVTAVRAPASWDTPDGGGVLRVERTTRESEWLRVGDGAPVFVETAIAESSWHRETGPGSSRQRFDYEARYDGSAGALGDGLAALHAGTYRDERALGPWAAGGAARLHGAPVALAWSHADATASGTGLAACAVALPRSESPVVRAAPGPFSGTVTQRVWVARDAPVPVLASCIVEAGPRSPVGFSFHLRLAAFERGREEVPLGDGAEPYAPRGLLPPQPTLVPGAPVDGDAPLEFPLRDAVRLLRDTDAEPLASFRDDGEAPFVVLDARYQAGPFACSGVEPLCDDLGDATRTRSPAWQFTLANAHGERLQAGVVRTRSQGATLEERVWARDPGPADDGLDPRRVPTHMAPLGAVLGDWLVRTGLTYEEWRALPGATLRIAFSPEALGPDGAYAGRLVLAGRVDRPAEKAGHDHASGARASCDPEGLLALTILSCVPDPPEMEHIDQPRTHAWSHDFRADDGAYLAHGFVNRSLAHRPIPPAPAAELGAPPEVRDAPPTAGWGAAAGAAAFSLLGAKVLLPRLRRLLGGALGLVLYAHVTREQALDHPTRRDLREAVRLDPGVTTKELCRRLGIGWGTAVYHLGVMEQHGFLVSHRGGRYRGWFLAATDPASRRRAATLRSMAAQRVLRFVEANPGTTQRELARAFGVDHVAIIFHARRLEGAGLVRKERRGRTVHYYALAAPAVEAMP